MSVCVTGAGWVTPLGSGIDEVWNRLVAGDEPPSQEVVDPVGNRSYVTYRVPGTALKNLPPHPRLRRASAISRFAAAAGLAALADAEVQLDKDTASRLALIFAVANGGVIYTKRFYSDIVNSGADAASPLLFPETVFNAAASHLAAIIGLTGATYTLVGDGSVGLTAIQMAKDLLADQQVDQCLVVAAEEADWLLCDAYQKWRLLRAKPPLEVFGGARGTILSEGAGAVLLGRSGVVQIQATAAGTSFKKRTDAPDALAKALAETKTPVDAIVISSANGTFIDSAELSAITQMIPKAAVYSPKPGLGEGVAASAIWQLIVAVEALKRKEMPLPQHPPEQRKEKAGAVKLANLREITVLSCGLNQQVGALRLGLASSPALQALG